MLERFFHGAIMAVYRLAVLPSCCPSASLQPRSLGCQLPVALHADYGFAHKSQLCTAARQHFRLTFAGIAALSDPYSPSTFTLSILDCNSLQVFTQPLYKYHGFSTVNSLSPDHFFYSKNVEHERSALVLERFFRRAVVAVCGWQCRILVDTEGCC